MSWQERTVTILDPDDARIAAFRDIRERDLVGRRGFIAEGKVVVEQLLASTRFAAKSLLILENRVAGLAEILSRVALETPIHVADRGTFDRIAGFPVHRGVMAHGEARNAAEADDDALLNAVAAAGGTAVAVVGIANHDNIGAIFRNAAAFGVGMVLVDEGSCDPLYRKALRVSVGSVLTVPYRRVASGEAALALLRAKGFRCLSLSPRGERDVGTLGRGEATALFLGAEGPGLPEALMARMETVAIDMAKGFDSLNVATSAAIALHRLFSAPPPQTPRPETPQPETRQPES